MNFYATKINDNGNIAVDDSILVKGYESAYGSKILTGFKPLFSAEAVVRLESAGYTVSGKTHTGEFGLDLVGEFSHFADNEDTIKGASAALVAEGSVKAALSVDVNGAPRRGAAQEGITFLKPTYGTVSRYGIISTAASGEQLGVAAADSKTVAEIMTVIAGHDDKDGTSLREEKYNYCTDVDVKGKKVAIVKELLEMADDDTKKAVKEFADKAAANGVVVEEISCDIFNVANVAWQILMSAETCNNVSRYDGVKFGHRSETYRNIDELYVNSRTEGFNFLTKAIILYGSDVLSKQRYADCYDKSLRIRRVVSEKFEELMKTYDAVLTPVCSTMSYDRYAIEDAFEKVFKESIFTAVPNLIGAPALVSRGVQLIGKNFAECTLLSIADVVEKEDR